MTNWMQTHTGKHIYPLEPDIDDIDIKDIAHALSNLCRFNGHCQEFYSVAQHSVIVCKLLPEDLKIPGLLHDASEAYLSDVPRPIKINFTEFQEYEDRMQRAICDKFSIEWPIPEDVKAVDRRVLRTEARDLMGNPDDWGVSGLEPYNFKVRPKPPTEAKRTFLAMASKWIGTFR